jgi:hypothetical protein
MKQACQRCGTKQLQFKAGQITAEMRNEKDNTHLERLLDSPLELGRLAITLTASSHHCPFR